MPGSSGNTCDSASANQTALLLLMAAVGLAALSVGCVSANAESMGMKKGHRLLLKSAVENADYTEVTLPIFEGQRSGETVWFVVTESSDKADAAARKIAEKLKEKSVFALDAPVSGGDIGARNATLTIMAGMLHEITVRHTAFAMKESNPPSKADYEKLMRSYRRLVQLMRSGDGAAAEAHWRKHLDTARALLLQGLETVKVRDVMG